MNLIAPFAALRVVPRSASDVAAPPYDVVTSDEARKLAREAPDSFLRVSHPEIDLPAGADPHSDEAYAQARANLERLMSNGRMIRESAPCLYVYRLVMGDHEQIGVAAAASVDAYSAGRIKKHELTRPDKERDRTRHALALRAHSGPVFLTYRQDAAIDDLVAAAAARPPDVDVTRPDGVRHSLWRLPEGAEVSALVDAFEALPAAYVADGHHRSAAAARVCERLRAENPSFDGTEPFHRFLAVLFPDDQVQILPYNRVVRTLGGLDAAAFVARLGEIFEVESTDVPVEPDRAGAFGLYCDGRWYRLTLDAVAGRDDPVARLDISRLARACFEPLLGITDPRTDERIDFVGGVRGTAELERRVDSGEMAAAFSLFPTRLEDMFAVADAGQVMPPKSTWFEPKLADGLLVLPLD